MIHPGGSDLSREQAPLARDDYYGCQANEAEGVLVKWLMSLSACIQQSSFFGQLFQEEMEGIYARPTASGS